MQPFRNLDAIHPRSLAHLAGQLSALVAGRLWLKVLIGLFIGLMIGFMLGPEAGLVDAAAGALIGNWLALPGMLFLAAVQMIVIPLVFASIILGLASTKNIEQLRRLGMVVVLFMTVLR